MIFLRPAILTLGVFMLGACASVRQSPRVSTTLSHRDVAPAKLSPPDFGTVPNDPAYAKAQADYHFTLAETLAFEGHGPRAAEEYKAALVYDPTSIHVRLRLASTYVHLGMMTEAIEQGELASTAAPDNIEAHVLLGGIYAGLKLYAPARAQFQQILDREPGHAEAALYLGALMAEESKYDEAIAYFTKLAANPKFVDTEKAYYYIGRVRADQGAEGYAEAKHAFAKALQLRPEYPEAAIALANIEFAHHEEAAAEVLLRTYQDKFGPTREMSRALSQYYLDRSDYERALTQLENVDGFERDNLNVKIQIALILIERKKYDQSAQRLEDILLLAPDSDKVHYYLGAVYEETGRSEQAIEHYGKVPAESSYYAESVIHGGHLLETTGHLDRAVALLAHAVETVSDQPALYAFYATLLDQRKDYATGVTVLTAAVTHFPDDVQLRFFLGTMQDRVGRRADAVAEMRHAIDADHDNVPALNYLAFTFAEQDQNLDQADEYARRALALSPGDGYILDTVGWVQFKRGQVGEAIMYLEAALKLKPNESVINEHLGDAYVRNQMWRRAQALYQKAMTLELDQARHSALRQKIEAVQTQSARLPAGI